MVFRDQQLVCDQCGKVFYFTVTEQRRLAQELGEEGVEAPLLCRKCRQPGVVPASAPEAEPAMAVVAPAAPVVEPVRQVDVEPEPLVEVEEPEEPLLEEPTGESADEAVGAVEDLMLEDLGIKIKLIGQVKWFSRRKGYGFVTKADGEELFFHRSDVSGAELSELQDGVQVEFQIRRTNKGLEAYDVSLLPTS